MAGQHASHGTGSCSSEAARRPALFLSLIDGANLPRPQLNCWIAGRECDCVWWTQGVMAELDGYAVHGTRQNFEGDRERDRVLQAEGWRVVRITWRQLCDSLGAVVRDLRALLVER